MPLPRANFVIFGQSNGGANGNALWTYGGDGQLFFDLAKYNAGKQPFQSAVDPVPSQPPMPGSSSPGGSIAARLGYLFANQPSIVYSQITYAHITRNGSPTLAWIPGGAFNPLIADVTVALAMYGLDVTAYLWIQGESDAAADHPPGAYYNNVVSMVTAMRSSGMNAPVFVANCTECHLQGSGGNPAGTDFELLQPGDRLNRWSWQARVQDEQRMLQLRHDLGIYPGANMDLARGRYDGCHLNGSATIATSGGQGAAALMWLRILLDAKANGKIQ